jgi:hypothetical protein
MGTGCKQDDRLKQHQWRDYAEYLMRSGLLCAEVGEWFHPSPAFSIEGLRACGYCGIPMD